MIKLAKFDFNRDVLPIDEIFRKQPELGVPSLSNIIDNASLIDEENGKLVGYGVVKIFAEGVLILDREIPKRDKATAVKLALDQCIKSARNAGIEYLYVISNMDSYSAVLRNRFGFEECTGALLMKSLRDKEN